MFVGSYYYVIPDHLPSLNMTSVYYLVFLFLSFVLIRLFKGILRQIFLILCSAFFIWTFSLEALYFVLGAAVYTYLCGLLLPRFKKPYFLLLVIAPFVGGLLYFKYLSESLLMPLGLSFYSFKAISYLTDIYLGKCESEKNPLTVGAYVLFFPCITSGPINRFGRFKEELVSHRDFECHEFSNGFVLVLLGIFEKIVFCDFIAYVVRLGFDIEASGMSVLLAIFLYSFQIYLDFDAVSNIAIGSARALGFDVGRNFHSPYLASSLKDFWRRWHISLSSWLRDYVYIPLGGSRKGKIRTYVNLLVTFVVSGVWHGSTWNFLLWGLLHGFVQIIENVIISRFDFDVLDKGSKKAVHLCGVVFNFVVVSLLWLVFRCSTLSEVYDILSRVSLSGGFNLSLTHNEWLWLVTVIVTVIVLDILRESFDMTDFLTHLYGVKWFIYFALILVFLVFGVYGGSYEAADFIYQFF